MSRGDAVIIQDADLEYDPADYGALVEPVLRGSEKVVYGSRRLGRTNVRTASRRYYLGGVLVTTVTNVLFGSRLTDVPTCYKVFEGELIRNLSFAGNRFDWGTRSHGQSCCASDTGSSNCRLRIRHGRLPTARRFPTRTDWSRSRLC